MVIKKKSIEIRCQITAVIPTGQYQNIQPQYSITETMDITDDEVISIRYDKLRKILQSKIDADYERVRVGKIKETIRLSERNGINFPHVTDIIGAINPINFDPELLAQYGSRGTVEHLRFTHFYKTKIWIDDPIEIPGAKLDYLKVKNGSLKLEFTSDLKGFWDTFGMDFKVEANELKVFNMDHMYCGTIDIYGEYKGIKSIVDLKTASDYAPKKLERYWKQLAAYANCVDAKQLVIIPLSPKKGYDKPIVCTDIDKYFKMFMSDRDAFKKLYNI